MRQERNGEEIREGVKEGGRKSNVEIDFVLVLQRLTV